jgi:hypothetical protein
VLEETLGFELIKISFGKENSIYPMLKQDRDIGHDFQLGILWVSSINQ